MVWRTVVRKNVRFMQKVLKELLDKNEETVLERSFYLRLVKK